MSLLGSIGKVLTGAAKTVIGGVVGSAIGGPVGGAIGAGIGSSGAKLATKGIAGAAAVVGAAKALPQIITKPGVGAVVGTAAGVGGSMLVDSLGRPVKKRRRRKGITPKDLMSFKRVARLIDKFSAPVHRLRKSSYKPKCN